MKNVHGVIRFNQEAWLEPHINIWILRQKAKNNFEKDFFKLINDVVFRKTMENVRKHRDIKPVTKEKKLFSIGTKF